jgi:1-acyl-sn-glycerol-3-phosphate acyltransferase
VRLFPTGRWGTLAPRDRYDFLTKKRAIPQAFLSRAEGNQARLAVDDVEEVNWYPGTVQAVYGLALESEPDPEQIAVKEWAARLTGQHPARIRVDLESLRVIVPTCPLNFLPFAVQRQSGLVTVQSGTGKESLSLEPVRDYIRARSQQAHWLMEDIWIALVEQFVRRVVISDPDAWSQVSSGPVLYLANHQTGVESMLFALVMGSLTHVDVAAVAKAEHQQSWIGHWMARAASYPGVSMPDSLQFVDRSDQQAVWRTVQQMEGLFARGLSLLVHVAGTRSLSARHNTETMSGLWVDLAMNAQVPIVPVRLQGGLPVQAAPSRLEFPWQYAGQDYYLGTPLSPETLQSMGYKERITAVIEAINGLGIPCAEETPNPGDLSLVQGVNEWMERHAVAEPEAVMAVLLGMMANPGPDTRQLLAINQDSVVKWPVNPRRLWLSEAAHALYGADGCHIQWTEEISE